MGKRQEAALLTRRKIVDAMRELLSEKRADQINIEDITGRAGVAKGTFYTYFKRKEDAIAEIANESYAVIREMALTSENTALDNLTTFLVRSAKQIEKDTLVIAQNWMKSVIAPYDDETNGIDKYQFDRTTLRAILQKAVEKGELNAQMPLESVTQMIVDTYYGAVAVWCISKGEADLYDSVIDFCRNGLCIILERYIMPA